MFKNKKNSLEKKLIFRLEGPKYDDFLKDCDYSTETIKAFERDMMKKLEMFADSYILEQRIRELSSIYELSFCFLRTKKGIKKEILSLSTKLRGIEEDIREIDKNWNAHEKLKRAYSIWVSDWYKIGG